MSKQPNIRRQQTRREREREVTRDKKGPSLSQRESIIQSTSRPHYRSFAPLVRPSFGAQDRKAKPSFNIMRKGRQGTLIALKG